MKKGTVAICIVTYNSAADLPGCLEALESFDYPSLELVIVDCASQDESADLAQQIEVAGMSKKALALASNEGFSGGMNIAFAQTDAEFLLTLNADARPAADFVSRLVARLEQPGGVRLGAATGRLVRRHIEGEDRPRLDACGMRLTPLWRHLDRGSGEPDHGQLSQPERVFGATGAASLFRREALLDVAIEGEIFDRSFHSFREDAELCFRLQERGWEVAYEPTALAEHGRRVLPERRRDLPPIINYHSLKNRYLLRIAHQTGGNFLRTFLPTLWRDFLALVYVLLFERSSIPAYTWLWRHRKELLRRRRSIQNRKTQSNEAVDRWFSVTGLPLEPLALQPDSDRRTDGPSWRK